jgi:hypothetical protein
VPCGARSFHDKSHGEQSYKERGLRTPNAFYVAADRECTRIRRRRVIFRVSLVNGEAQRLMKTSRSEWREREKSVGGRRAIIMPGNGLFTFRNHAAAKIYYTCVCCAHNAPLPTTSGVNGGGINEIASYNFILGQHNTAEPNSSRTLQRPISFWNTRK